MRLDNYQLRIVIGLVYEESRLRPAPELDVLLNYLIGIAYQRRAARRLEDFLPGRVIEHARALHVTGEGVAGKGGETL